MEKIEVLGSTVDFFKSIKDGISTYQFDTSKCGPPDPMVNAMAGLQLLDENSKLVMLNHQTPGGLFPKIDQEFDYDVKNLPTGGVAVTFTKKSGASNTTDFTQNTCNG